MWNYLGLIGSDYDENVKRICKACEDVRIYVSKGEIVRYIAIADAIGHVRSRSLRILVVAFSIWIEEFVSHCRRSREN